MKHRPNDVELASAVGRTVTGFGDKDFPGEEGSVTSTFERDLPAALRFTGSWIVTKPYYKVFPFSYKLKPGLDTLDLQIVVYAKIDDADVMFPWDMVTPKTYKEEVQLRFKTEDFGGSADDRLRRYGFDLAPGEGIMLGYTIKRGSD